MFLIDVYVITISFLLLKVKEEKTLYKRKQNISASDKSILVISLIQTFSQVKHKMHVVLHSMWKGERGG